MDIDVQHDETEGKYYAVIDGREAVCEYGPAGEGKLNFFHTYVPTELRGKGVADELVRLALDDALARGSRSSPPAGSSASTSTGTRSTRRRWQVDAGRLRYPARRHANRRHRPDPGALPERARARSPIWPSSIRSGATTWEKIAASRPRSRICAASPRRAGPSSPSC